MTKILIIEDEQATRENMAEALMYNGYSSIEAPDGKEGVALALSESPDLILCDINMPEMNGYEVLYALRNDRSTANIPFIFLTAQTDRHSMRDGMNLGADDYISKPFELFELLEAIDTRLKKQALITEGYEEKLKTLRYSIVQALPHELRTPLIGIIGYAELMASDTEVMDPEQVRMMSAQIAKSGWRLHHVLENYLIYAQIELTANDPLRKNALAHDRVTHPDQVLQTVIEKMTAIYECDIVCNMPPYVPQLAISEENLLKILQEVIDNACKFRASDTKVVIRVLVHDSKFIIKVENEGRGMTEEQINMVGAYMQFERAFYEQQGLGLGLIIARRMTEIYNGSFSIASVKDQLTVVTLAFMISD